MERNLHYTTDLAVAGGSSVTDNPLVINVARDLSAVNRKKFHCTTRKGVPLVYDLTVQCAIEDPSVAITVQPITASSNYCYKNGAKLLQKALDNKADMAGIDLHAWNRTVNYSWARDMSQWVVMPPTNAHPDNGTPYAIAGGEWEFSKFSIDHAAGTRDQFIVHLCGEHFPVGYQENADPTAVNIASVSLPNMFLSSIGPKVDHDEGAQAEFSLLEQLLRPHADIDDLHYAQTELSQTNDDAPYAQYVPGASDSPDFDHGVLKGQMVLSAAQGMVQTTRLLAPFGWLGMRSKRTLNVDSNADYYVQCNGIFKMR